MTENTRSIDALYYDADCAFCVGVLRPFERILARRRIVFVPLQTPGAAATLGVRDEHLLDEMRLRLPDGRVFGGAAAVAELARRIWWAWPFWALTRLPGAMPPLRAIYRWIARRRGCAAGACEIDAPRRV